MNKDFEKCLKNKRIIKQGYVKNLVQDELKAARALLHAKGYREKSHFCLKAAIQALYVDEGILDQKYVDDFDTTMLLRETADYKSDFSREGAESSLESAESFLAKAEEILK